ncbi:aminotransferase-like domain-containing protein [Marinobacterium weihaiense]|uniref:PLP-dependent aminotransferase family protein n=1 Tax=Marinobacterium weihaiense TaxID=2851016 RepID=A0ABS6MET3_9GAMM|nr:PLP-dependent aminotransferase family protein [Marinobacterium weihaiense]MBV0934831.1 PLP-dependent aminotransferase family protein [Marinobacterium weihaiense]
MSYRYQDLERWLLQGIEQQRWQPGERLPSIRELCRQKQLSKATVMHALQRLEALGLIAVRPKSGYFVLPPPAPVEAAATPPAIRPPRPVTVSDVLLDIMQRSAAFDLLPMPDTDERPRALVTLNRCIGRALRRQKGSDHQYYDEPAGSLALREQLVVHALKRGWHAAPERLCITSGCQHALFLALMACCQPGDVVAVESPGFYGVLQLLQQLGLKGVEVPAAGQGMDMDALDAVLQRWPVKACIVSPAFATPGGALMPIEARKRLMALADRHDLALIEDDIYADTAFMEIPDPLKALDTENRVILCSSFSKSLSRDLRLGWVSGARWHDRILQLKLVTQLASSRYLQQGVADFMADGSYAGHLRSQRTRLRQQRDQLLQVLNAWPVECQISRPEGGLAVWLELPLQIDTLALYHRAREQGVIITPGPLFSMTGQYRHCLRMSFAHPWNERRLQALQQLGVLLAP